MRLEDRESLSHGHWSWEGPLTVVFLMTSFGQEPAGRGPGRAKQLAQGHTAG